jgi:hypothetical protein
MDAVDSGLYPMAGFDISGVKPLGFADRRWVIYIYDFILYFTTCHN